MNILKVGIVFLIFLANVSVTFADNFSKADELVRKSFLALSPEESYDYLHKAEDFYMQEYEKNPINVRALLGLSKVNQLLQNRSEAKLYVLKAYNLNPKRINGGYNGTTQVPVIFVIETLAKRL